MLKQFTKMYPSGSLLSCNAYIRARVEGSGGGGGRRAGRVLSYNFGLFRYVPQDRVWFLRFSILK